MAEEAPEPQYEEKMVPHSYPLKAKEELVGVRRLSKDATKEAKARIKDLEKRDNDKYKTDEAKNDFESIIYEFKDFLYDDENSYYETETEIEALLEACSEARDWLDDAGAEVGYKTFQTKTYELQSKYSKLTMSMKPWNVTNTASSGNQFRTRLRHVQSGLFLRRVGWVRYAIGL